MSAAPIFKTCVIVEDNLPFQHLLIFHMRKHFNKIMVFDRVADSLRYLKNNKADLIILDHNLSDELTSIDMLNQLSKRKSDTPVIVLSAQENPSIAAETIKKGAVDYIEKNEKSMDKIHQSVLSILRKKFRSEDGQHPAPWYWFFGFVASLVFFFSIYQLFTL